MLTTSTLTRARLQPAARTAAARTATRSSSILPSKSFHSSSRASLPPVKLMGVAMANKVAQDPSFKPEKKVSPSWSRTGACGGAGS